MLISSPTHFFNCIILVTVKRSFGLNMYILGIKHEIPETLYKKCANIKIIFFVLFYVYFL